MLIHLAYNCLAIKSNSILAQSNFWGQAKCHLSEIEQSFWNDLQLIFKPSTFSCNRFLSFLFFAIANFWNGPNIIWQMSQIKKLSGYLFYSMKFFDGSTSSWWRADWDDSKNGKAKIVPPWFLQSMYSAFVFRLWCSQWS